MSSPRAPRPRVSTAFLAAIVTLTGCSAPAAPGASPAPLHDNTQLPLGRAPSGQALADKSSCAECHQADYAGAGFFPNLTPDAASGLGAWNDAEIAAAIRDGIARDGAALCATMARFDFSDQEVADLIAYLRTLPAIARAPASVCPGHG